jgi:transposase
MWETENRVRYDRSTLRYPSDLTDGEWAIIAPLIPPARRGGNKRTVNVREIVKRPDVGKFVVLPKRWIVERTIAWLNRCRRLAKDWECLNRNALAFLRWASVRLMLRKLCQNTICS